MSSSVVSVYDNVSLPENLSRSGVYNALNDLLNVNADIEVRIYCPLCVNSFSFKFSLFEHLRRFHSNFLLQANTQTLKFKECPFCNAKFYGKHLTAKHVLHHHYKVIKKLFVIKNKLRCAFCNVKLSRENFNRNVKHIESLHFLDFVEEFKKMFLNDTLQDMSSSEFGNSTSESSNSQDDNWEDLCFKNLAESKLGDFDEASMINCYDFTDLKQQLDNLKDVQSTAKSNVTSPSKSILKDIKNTNSVQKSARRVLKFDLPSDDEDKENSFFSQRCHLKQISPDEYNLLCNDNNSDKVFTSNSSNCGEPQHCSTPNSKVPFTVKNDNHCGSNTKPEKSTKKPKSKMKTKIYEKKSSEFEYQCGKCRLLFRENFELVCHVKNTHKKFSLNALQPGYHCAICDAKFFKNRYLKKHHNLHKPY